jgi:hypothetical protein
MKAQVGKHDILSKVQQLQTITETGQWSEECVLVWEGIDKVLSEARIASKRKCKAKRSDLCPWSPALQEAGCRLLYWKLRMSAHTCNKVNVNTMAKLTIQLKVSPTYQGPQSGITILNNILTIAPRLYQGQSDSAKFA